MVCIDRCERQAQRPTGHSGTCARRRCSDPGGPRGRRPGGRASGVFAVSPPHRGPVHAARLMRPPSLLRRPLLWIMVYAGLLAYGAYALWDIPAEVLPRFVFPQIRLVVHAPGYSTREMESLIARPLEGQLMGLPGLATLRATLAQGTAQFSAQFVEGTDPQLALQAAYGAIDRARASLPPGIRPYAEIMGNAVNEVADYGVKLPADVPAWRAQDAIRTRVLPALRALPGVQRVELFGAGAPTLWIQPDPGALIEHHVGVEALV